ncbi:hypothetical protein APS_1315 [Acetobacter pasteurianus subsp. pasteurianus LMG 1262 = NBRC 106471]|nr:hypothetical protein ApDm4_1355 [Acetobacter pomorum]GAB30713.1 hypothetical protein APS_1315 [Acetobacter pasteurianus subsp. pasteurianus LMG 1262 = NBRC 106471]
MTKEDIRETRGCNALNPFQHQSDAAMRQTLGYFNARDTMVSP